jgi:hypothetical protein
LEKLSCALVEELSCALVEELRCALVSCALLSCALVSCALLSCTLMEETRTGLVPHQLGGQELLSTPQTTGRLYFSRVVQELLSTPQTSVGATPSREDKEKMRKS